MAEELAHLERGISLRYDLVSTNYNRMWCQSIRGKLSYLIIHRWIFIRLRAKYFPPPSQ